jgi:hypothetical protein
MRYTCKIAEELGMNFEPIIDYRHHGEKPHEIIDGAVCNIYYVSDDKIDEQNYHIYSSDEYNVLDEIVYLMESDSKRQYELEIIVKSKGFNTNSNEYCVIIESEKSPDKHVSLLLDRDFEFNRLDVWKDEQNGEIHHLYRRSRHLDEVLLMLRDTKPLFDECVEIYNDSYLSEDSVERSLDASGITNPKKRDQLRLKMLEINDTSTAKVVIVNKYFEGWLSSRRTQANDANIIWISGEDDDGNDIQYLDMEIKVAKELFRKWRGLDMTDKKRFVKYGK